MKEREFRCPLCGRLLFTGLFADLTIFCKCSKEFKHKDKVRIIAYPTEPLMLTADSSSDMIATVQSKEGMTPIVEQIEP
jgi:hypothetical protein